MIAILKICWFSALLFAANGVAVHPKDSTFLKAEGVHKEAMRMNPFAPDAHHPSDRLQCGVTEQVGAHTDKYEDCPANCPYFAQNRKDADHCTFLCVPGEECGRWNPNKPIPDTIKKSKTCRGPMVPFCKTPTLDGKDTCEVCSNGYALWEKDKQCYFQHWTPLIVGTVIFVVIFTVVAVWAIDLCCREP